MNSLREKGYSVGYGHPTQGWLGRVGVFIGNDFLFEPKQLFCNTQMGVETSADEAVSFPSVENLSFNTTGIKDDELRLLGKLPKLKYLSLSSTQISDEGIKNLTGLSLITLHLTHVPITDISVEYLSQIKSLRYLEISPNAISSNGVAKLKMALPNCEINVRQ